jgi:hypothetical protein
MIAPIVDAPSHDGLLEVLERTLRLLDRVRRVERRPVRVRTEEVRDRAVGGLVGQRARVAGRGDRGRVAVVAAVRREHLALAGEARAMRTRSRWHPRRRW